MTPFTNRTVFSSTAACAQQLALGSITESARSAIGGELAHSIAVFGAISCELRTHGEFDAAGDLDGFARDLRQTWGVAESPIAAAAGHLSGHVFMPKDRIASLRISRGDGFMTIPVTKEMNRVARALMSSEVEGDDNMRAVLYAALSFVDNAKETEASLLVGLAKFEPNQSGALLMLARRLNDQRRQEIAEIP